MTGLNIVLNKTFYKNFLYRLVFHFSCDIVSVAEEVEHDFQ